VAQRGQGAFRLDGDVKRLRVSGAASLAESTAVISRSHVSREELEFISSLRLRGYTRLGSSLKALRICSGEAEIYFAANAKMKQWDTCASTCIVIESGGRVTDMFGGEITYKAGAFPHEKGIVISNGRVHDEFIRRCGPLLKQFGS
jgi:3'(2'), 5'-bisphosphate nucleotidase